MESERLLFDGDEAHDLCLRERKQQSRCANSRTAAADHSFVCVCSALRLCTLSPLIQLSWMWSVSMKEKKRKIKTANRRTILSYFIQTIRTVNWEVGNKFLSCTWIARIFTIYLMINEYFIRINQWDIISEIRASINDNFQCLGWKLLFLKPNIFICHEYLILRFF